MHYAKLHSTEEENVFPAIMAMLFLMDNAIKKINSLLVKHITFRESALSVGTDFIYLLEHAILSIRFVLTIMQLLVVVSVVLKVMDSLHPLKNVLL